MDLPSIQLLEETHRFPGSYMFKVIGKAENGFVARVVAAVREAMEVEADPPFRIRHTSGGRHVSVTLEPLVNSPEQVIAIYRRVGETVGVVLLL